jgi:hypothetical protein
MLLRPEYLTQKLDRSLSTKDGGTLDTIRDDFDYMNGVGERRERRDHLAVRVQIDLRQRERVDR